MAECKGMHYRLGYDFCSDSKSWQGLAYKFNPATDESEIVFATAPHRTYLIANEELWAWCTKSPEFTAALLNGMNDPKIHKLH